MKRELTLFDKSENVKRLLMVFYVALAVLLIIDFFVPKHTGFPWAGRTDFFAAYGFLSCVVLILIAKILRLFVKRDEAYYGSERSEHPSNQGTMKQ